MKELKASIDGLQFEVQGLRRELHSEVSGLRTDVTSKFSDLQSSVDRYLKRTEGWYQEFTVLKGKHEKLSGALVQKGVVSEKDTLL